MKEKILIASTNTLPLKTAPRRCCILGKGLCYWKFSCVWIFIYIDLMTKASMSLNIYYLNSATSYCGFKYGKQQLRIYACDVTLKDENVTSTNKKAENLFAPSEEVGLVSRM